MKIKSQEILLMKIPLNRACGNHYLDSSCIFTVMIPEMMPRAICCKKTFRINKNGSKRVFILMDFPEFTINHES